VQTVYAAVGKKKQQMLIRRSMNWSSRQYRYLGGCRSQQVLPVYQTIVLMISNRFLTIENTRMMGLQVLISL